MKILKYGIALLFFMTLWGCGKGNSNAPAAIDPTTGKHAVGWFDVGTGGAHPRIYFADPGSCEECHGKDLKGGISKVSCSPGPNNSGCHQIFPHAAGFNDPAAHGKFATGVLTPNGIFGMAHCQQCHGLNYTGGVGPSCIKCHQQTGSNPATNAPHGANWKVSGRHSKSDVTNAAACFKCHAGGAFSHPAQSPAPSGTEPGCFNGTLCHNNAIAHAVPFINATSHGKAIKITNDWPFCGNCHAAPSSGFQRFNVSIGSLTNGCETCHGKPYLAHPQMWLQGRGTGTPTTIGGSVLLKNTSHIDVPAANIMTSCTTCHGITAPSVNPSVPTCATASGQLISGIRCHFTSPVDGAGQSNGCKSCHNFSSSTDFANITSNKHSKHLTLLNSAFPDIRGCLACHNSPVPGRGAVHADGTPNVAVLAQFGLAATYNNSSKSCSSVNCHGSTTPAWTSASVGCLACHATPPNGTIYPNAANAHAKHVFACEVCHNGAGFGTSRHALGLVSAAVVSLLPSQAGAAAAYDPSTKTCANVICHNGRATTPAWTSSNNGCTACHTDPPNTFRHSAHWAITTDIKCDACHNDGPGVATHMTQNPVVVGSPLPAKYNESGAVATYNPVTGQCTNVSCHGGKPNIAYGPSIWPAWKSATVFNQANCYNCHLQRIGTDPGLTEAAYRAAVAAGTRPYIGPFSGNLSPAASSNNLHWGHFFLIGGLPPTLCLNCHPAPGASHFARVTDGHRDLPRGFAPVGGATTQVTSYDSNTGTCVTVCHVPRPW